MNKFSKILPSVLSAVGVIGTAVTVVLAVKATPKAVKIIEKKAAENGSALDKKDTVKAVWKEYIPAAGAFLFTSACIIGANISNRRVQASLTAAYALVSKSYNRYKNKVIELYGKEANDKIISSIAAEKSSAPVITGATCCSNTSLEFGDIEEEVLFYDEFSDRYFTSTVSKVLQAEYHLNRNYVLRGYVSLNEFYDFLGISHFDGGDDIGWVCDGEINWIDFDHFKKTLDDGLEVRFIQMIFFPYGEYSDEIDSSVSR